MNFKERGITIGDLLVILIIIIFTSILVKTFKKDREMTLNLSNQEKIFKNQHHYKNIISINYIQNFF